MITAQADRTSEAPALISCEAILSYIALEQSADRFARRLLKAGVRKGEVVAILSHHSFESVIAILGIWKAGAVYLPLDPTAPRERIEYILRDAGATHLFFAAAAKDQGFSGTIITHPLDGSFEQSDNDFEKLPCVLPDSLAYIIYTSGSTGMPKGVQLNHHGLRAFVESDRTTFDIDETTRLLLLSRSTFDSSVAEIMVPLCAGGSVCVASPIDLETGPRLSETIRSMEVNTLYAAPSALGAIAEWDHPNLRVVVAGGEECTPRTTVQWAGQCRLFNDYGPTETTISAVSFEVLPDAVHSVPIGRPRSGKQVHVVDGKLDRVPPGVIGELCIAGDGLAWGYLNKAGQTADRFVALPFEGDGDRMYRSGDLAWWDPDGQLHFVGRIDNQVQLRGYRIELDEIECALLKHDAVVQAIVTAQILGREQALVAHLTTLGDVGAADLRIFLRNWLPDYMLPSAFVFVDDFPLTAHGKIDRTALPLAGEVTASFVEPDSPSERALAVLWQEVLSVERVGVEDDFFELGGNSLTAMRIAARAHDIFGTELPVRAIFENPTVRSQASFLSIDD